MPCGQSSAYGRFLDHDGLADSGLGDAALLGVFVGGWLLMLVAMMLPTAWSLVGLFAGVVARRSDRTTLLAALIGGYLAVWLAAGVAAFVGDTVLHGVVEQVAWISGHPRVVAVSVVALAGAYQFAPLKERCLEKCRSPRMMIFAGWRGVRPLSEAFSLGVRHGRFCVGCCWALMLVMFAVGLGSIGWMLAIGALMALKKNAPFGARLTAPLGVALLIAAGALAVGGVT